MFTFSCFYCLADIYEIGYVVQPPPSSFFNNPLFPLSLTFVWIFKQSADTQQIHTSIFSKLSQGWSSQIECFKESEKVGLRAKRGGKIQSSFQWIEAIDNNQRMWLWLDLEDGFPWEEKGWSGKILICNLCATSKCEIGKCYIQPVLQQGLQGGGS